MKHTLRIYFIVNRHSLSDVTQKTHISKVFQIDVKQPVEFEMKVICIGARFLYNLL